MIFRTDQIQDRHAPEKTGKLVGRILKDYLRRYAFRICVAIFFMIMTALMTGSLAMLMEPLINDVFQAAGPDHDEKVGLLWRILDVHSVKEKLTWISILIFCVFFIKGISSYLQAILMNNVGQHVVADIQSRMYNHLMDADLSYFHAQRAGQLISRLINDVNVMRSAMAECLTGIGKSAMMVVILVSVMFYQDWILSCMAFIAFPLAAVMVARIGKRLRKVSFRAQTEMASFSTLLNQTFQGIRHVKAYGMEEYEKKRVGGVVRLLFELSHKTFRVSAATTPITEILSGIAIVSVIGLGGYRVIEGHSTPGDLFSFITAFILAYDPMKRLARLNAQLQTGLAASERVFELLDTQAQIINHPDAKPIKVSDHGVEFNQVSFSYQGDEATQALDHVNLTVPSGKTVAIVGSSGSGKSTLLNLIPRFYDSDTGTITIGDQDVKKVTLDSLRQQIALVTQEISLFDDTVRANIAYGRMDATDEEIVEAAKDAAAHDFIMALPEGYDTPVGEQGVSLSGGQRQRIAIARAMLKNAPILLLDEATSALDTESERAVQEALKRLQKGRTTLIVAHRLTTIADADYIYVLDNGRIVEAGTHDELTGKGGFYTRLYGLHNSAA